MSSTERPALADVIAAAIQFAHEAGHVEHEEITPDDFALQRSPAGWSYATYVGGDFVITATIGPDGEASTDVGYVEWMGSPDDGGDEDEDQASPFVDIYLPGDAPATAVPPTAEQIHAALHAAVVRDQYGAIRRRDGTYIAAADTTIEQLHARIGAHVGDDSPRSLYLRESYTLAIDLITSEQARAVSADA